VDRRLQIEDLSPEQPERISFGKSEICDLKSASEKSASLKEV